MYVIRILSILSIKIIFLVISFGTTIVSIVNLKKLPDKRFSLEWNRRRMDVYETLSMIVDFILVIIVTRFFAHDTDYGTGIEVIMGLLVLVVLTPICIVTGLKYFRRKKEYCLDNKEMMELKGIYGIGSHYGVDIYVIFTVLLKAVFVMVGTVWLIEVW